MADAGFFNGQRVELIDGEIIDMAAQNNPHQYVLTMTRQWLESLFDQKSHWVRDQSTLRLSHSAPDPDLAVVDGAPTPHGPIPDRALLVVEISETTLATDLGEKANLYASAQIADYWVMDIPHRCIVVHRKPVADPTARFGWRYDSISQLVPGGSLAPLALPGATIDPAKLLP